MSVCYLFCVSVVLRVGSGLTTSCFPVQGALKNIHRIKKLKEQGAVEPLQ
jgi:hypothetical protein